MSHILKQSLENERNRHAMSTFKCCRICRIGYVALPAFGVGVLTSLFLPPCVTVGISAAVSIAFGVACVMSGY